MLPSSRRKLFFFPLRARVKRCLKSHVLLYTHGIKIILLYDSSNRGNILIQFFTKKITFPRLYSFLLKFISRVYHFVIHYSIIVFRRSSMFFFRDSETNVTSELPDRRRYKTLLFEQ
ncbi:hypothetical protein PUN28_004443 [Cardiocondyla obscurior]|uniref:Uncharacterized protein n=1 Tax=Cardiocondyla obscurior TaxID=286306 RepID=A0AAW2GDQ4_9HYME